LLVGAEEHGEPLGNRGRGHADFEQAALEERYMVGCDLQGRGATPLGILRCYLGGKKLTRFVPLVCRCHGNHWRARKRLLLAAWVIAASFLPVALVGIRGCALQALP
jgi:hypothetical protein